MTHAHDSNTPRRLWVLLSVGAAIVLAALGWVSYRALSVERREHEARAQAQFQQTLRLALWRADSAMTPIIAREAARPYFEYRSFYPARDAYARAFDEPDPGEVLVPSPLLTQTDPLVKLYFQSEPGGTVTSPQLPGGLERESAELRFVTPYAAQNAAKLLDEVQTFRLLNTDDFDASQAIQASGGRADSLFKDQLDGLPVNQSVPFQVQGRGQVQRPPEPQADYADRQRLAEEAQRRNTAQESSRASKAVEATADAKKERGISPADQIFDDAIDKRTIDQDAQGQLAGASAPPAAPLDQAAAEKGKADGERVYATAPLPVTQGPFVGRWIDRGKAPPELVFVRRVTVDGRTFDQGFWLNWESLRSTLLEQATDLFPDARLEPVLGDVALVAPEVLGRMLATVPAELVVPQPALGAMPRWSPLRSALLAAWVLVLAAIAAVASVVRASTELAERRGKFVSAVTHELRTPLTTFCLYSQMLADDMVPDVEARREYARTLYSESQRLSRIVESVLEFARLGRSSPRQMEAVSIGALRERIEPGLARSCERAGLALRSALEPLAAADAPIRTDPALVERIVSNLVDNACKYGTAGSQSRVELDWLADGRALRIRVRDFGPGVPSDDAGKIFRPFVRGSAHAHGTVPGLGLGLALSRGLAQQLGGDLRLTGHAQGAEFTLDLPLAG